MNRFQSAGRTLTALVSTALLPANASTDRAAISVAVVRAVGAALAALANEGSTNQQKLEPIIGDFGIDIGAGNAIGATQRLAPPAWAVNPLASSRLTTRGPAAPPVEHFFGANPDRF